ncbi:MAG TPA: LarC family nickel insertion protein [Candidatus Nitrosotalea sp.]|nr:LarC family nickel insertion protein [Candidatus Nitrosotalea sp.]
MRIAYFDCRSGISGDMTLGALIDAGAQPDLLQRTVSALGLADEVQIALSHQERGHLGGVRVEVRVQGARARNLTELTSVVAAAPIPEPVRQSALGALGRLGEVEAAIHGLPAEKLHLHELGGADTLVDLVGAFWLLDDLGPEQVYASPLPAPRPPHSAPATLRLLAGSGAVLEPDSREEELVTPTGAAILTQVARFSRPALTLERAGWGLGSRPTPGNALAVWIGEGVGAQSEICVLEANLDDMAPNLIAALAEDLMKMGARDVSVGAVTMKKGRPGHLLAVMVEPEDEVRLAHVMLERSTTLGVRASTARRHLAARRWIEVATEFGPVRVKVKELGGRVLDVAAEYEDARRLGGDVALIMRRATEAARRQLELP